MLTFLLVVHALVAAALVAVILMQRSEGGGLASGGSPAGLMSARGAADFLTRTTSVLAAIFIILSIGLAALATMTAAPARIDTSLKRAQPVEAPAAAPANPATPAPAPADNGTVPLAR
ncbi:preprotein translocase subunit SecG [uncultured Sphingomonas sp.]|mgnify:CR=1 FL=1|uniref:preprotein translocase subunit SecG n=1 Tax=uncultured Sphingomonas sp. TaxID=158754 RepID=UPI0025EF9C7B|nr:preprotein translocase subunit SecG [uncultured Sphingomonas sp.]